MTTPHSIAEFTDPEVSPANNRHLTVSYASRYPDYSRIPALTLKGQWLEAVGFTTGTEVDVKVMNGCIVLTAQQPQPEESELMQSLRQVCKLSARKQKQVQAFISVIADKSCKPRCPAAFPLSGLQHPHSRKPDSRFTRAYLLFHTLPVQPDIP